MICREAPVTCHGDVALEGCLERRGWDIGFESYCGIKTGSMVFVVVVVVIMQYALKNCLWQMLLGANRK